MANVVRTITRTDGLGQLPAFTRTTMAMGARTTKRIVRTFEPLLEGDDIAVSARVDGGHARTFVAQAS